MLQENTNLQNVNVLHENVGLPKPNLRKFTENEKAELGLKVYELSINGREDEATELGMQVSIDADVLNSFKEKFGIGYLIESGLNLSEAVDKYGEEWLKK